MKSIQDQTFAKRCGFKFPSDAMRFAFAEVEV